MDYSTDTADMYYAQALKLSSKINYISGVISAKNVKGLLFRFNGQFDEALKIGKEVVELRLKYGPAPKLTGAFTNLGSVYLEMGDYANAINYFNKALENAVRWKQIENQLLILTNIAIVYNETELNDLALETFEKAVILNKQLNSEVQKAQEAQLYVNIAGIYEKRGLYKEAYKYFKVSYDTYKKENNTRLLGVVVKNLTMNTLNNKDLKSCEFFISEMASLSKLLNENEYTASLHSVKATYFLYTGKYEEALAEVDKGLALIDTVSYQLQYGSLLGVKSDCYTFLKDFKKSIEFSNKALSVIKQTTSKTQIAELYMNQSRAYKGMNDYKMSLLYFEKSILLRDSINTESFDTRIATLNSVNKLDKKERELALSNTEKEKISLENKRQTILLIAGSIVGLLVLILLVFSMRAYKVKQKDNILLNTQKEEIESKNNGLLESKKEIEHQKNIVEEKQKEMVDSINYALQIQKTLIANHDFVNQTIPDSFVFFKPKDIVSGDFYWAASVKTSLAEGSKNLFYLAVCDSTGHGVPGAFMSLLNINYLNEAIKEKGILKPNEVFDHVRKRLIETISQNGRQDGMDGILICIEENSNTITYAAANNAPVLISNNELTELEKDKMPVGQGERIESFKSHTLNFKKGDVLYLYTDGYADQFGGPNGKKFKYKALNELLLANSSLAMNQQLEQLNHRFQGWKCELEQIDVVCIVGIRL